MKKLLAALAFIATTPLIARAGNSEGVISNHIVNQQGKLFIVAGTPVNKPACSTNGAWAVDLVGPNAAGGRAILAMILAARAAGQTVHIVGTGVCDVWGDRETVSYVEVAS